MTELRTLKVALLGCGNVGAQVARILIEDADTLAARQDSRAARTRVFDVGHTPAGEPFIVMELLRAQDLRCRLDDHGPNAIR